MNITCLEYNFKAVCGLSSGEIEINQDKTIKQKPSSLSNLWKKSWPQNIDEFEAFTEMFQDRLYRFIFYRVHNHQDTEDIIQSVFLQAYTKRVKLKYIQNNAGPYLFKMAFNAYIDHFRKRKRQNETPIDTIPSDSFIQDRDGIEAIKETLEIKRLLQQLPEKQAEVIRLRVLDDLDFEEIAQILGCFTTSIRSRYRYGVNKLKQIIKEEEMRK